MALKPKPRYASKRNLALFGLLICAVLIAIFAWAAHQRAERAEWPEAQVTVSEFRTKLTRISESTHGTIAVYKAEAHVSYPLAGKRYDQWLPILSPSASQHFLQLELNNLNKQSCQIHWNPVLPKDAFLTCNWSLNPP